MTNKKTVATRKSKIGWFNYKQIAFTLLFFGVIAQMRHFYNVTEGIFTEGVEAGNSGYEGFLFCCAFGGAILFYTARGKQNLVIFFSAIEATVNLYYASVHCKPDSMAFVMGILLGIVLPLSNYFYCHEMFFGNTNSKEAKPEVKAVTKKRTKRVPLIQEVEAA